MEDLLSFFGPEVAWPWVVFWNELGIEKVISYHTHYGNFALEIHYSDKGKLDYVQITRCTTKYDVLYVERQDMSELRVKEFDHPEQVLEFITDAP